MAAVLGVTMGWTSLVASAQDLSFTYQGEIRDGGVLVDGAADIRFRLFADPTGAVELGSPVVASAVDLRGGRFATVLNFGVAPPPGATIQIEVRRPADPTDTQPFVTLAPRQAITNAPSAISAALLNGQPQSFFQSASNLTSGVLPSAQLSGLYLSSVNFENTGNTFRGSFAGSGVLLTNLNASNLTSGTLPPNRLAGTFTQIVTFNNPGNTFVGFGAGLTGLNASSIAGGLLSPARGGTGSTITSATTGHVLKWNGSAFTPQPDAGTIYTAGAGIQVSGSVISVASNAVTAAMLASDTGGLTKVTGGRFGISPSGGMSSDFPISVNNLMQATEFQYLAPTTSFAMVGGAEFQSRDGSALSHADVAGVSGVHMNTVSTAGIIAPVGLPHQAIVKAMRLYVVDQSTTVNLTLNLVQINAASGASTIAASTSSAGAVPGVRVFEVTNLSIPIDNQNQVCQLQANPSGGGWPGTNIRVVGVQIEYTMVRAAR